MIRDKVLLQNNTMVDGRVLLRLSV